MTDDTSDSPAMRFGYAGLIGRPNAGKSTLLNQILGAKLAITSHKPQTTRNRIAGIHTDDTMQLVLVDTPGIHDGSTELNRTMVKQSMDVLGQVDVVCWLVDLTRLAGNLQSSRPMLDEQDLKLAAAVQKNPHRFIMVGNKVDLLPRESTLPVIAEAQRLLGDTTLIPLSARSGENVDRLFAELRTVLPVGPAMYPPDQWTEVTERFLASEIIRNQLYKLLSQELPYCANVEISQFNESQRETKGLVRIHAEVIVERGSQKGIVIGKGGTMLKKIGTLARGELEEMLQCRVYLELFVKVEKDWTRTRAGLVRAGFLS
jgi:GTP-binding protein Era